MQIPLHPAIVHLPLGLALVLPLVMGGLALALWRGWLRRRAWLVVVGLQVALVASAIVALNTGESEEHRVEQVVPKAATKAHESRAELFTWAAGIVGALAAALFLLPAGRATHTATALLTALGIAVAGLALWTGRSGGELVYRHGAAAAYGASAGGGAPSTPPPERNEHRDDG